MEIPNITTEGVGGSLILALLSFLSGKRLFSAEKVKTAVDETNVVAAAAQTAVIVNLQHELERIARNFGRVLKELEQSHAENIKLRESNIELLDKLSEMQDTINQMKEQLNAFERRRQQCGECENDKPAAVLGVKP